MSCEVSRFYQTSLEVWNFFLEVAVWSGQNLARVVKIIIMCLQNQGMSTVISKNNVIRNNWYILKTNAKESTFSKALAQHFPVMKNTLQQSDQRDGNS